MFLPDAVRLSLRRTARLIIKKSPMALKRLVARVPFSRFHGISGCLFWGEEKIRWRGISVKINPGEIYGYYPYFLNIYSDEELEKLIELCKTAHIFADVGANIGLFSLAVARACPKIEVFAFEPDRGMAMKFRENLCMNHELSARVRLIESAVADTEGRLFFQPSTDPENRATGHLVDFETPYVVSTMRLDEFFESFGRYPDVVKIDVEGAECRVLEGMRSLFDKGYPKAALIETHSFCQEDAVTFNTKVKRVLEEGRFNLFQLKSGNWERLDQPESWPGRLHILALKR